MMKVYRIVICLDKNVTLPTPLFQFRKGPPFQIKVYCDLRYFTFFEEEELYYLIMIDLSKLI